MALDAIWRRPSDSRKILLLEPVPHQMFLSITVALRSALVKKHMYFNDLMRKNICFKDEETSIKKTNSTTWSLHSRYRFDGKYKGNANDKSLPSKTC